MTIIEVPAADYEAALDGTGSLTAEACAGLCHAKLSSEVLGCTDNGPVDGAGGSGGGPTAYSLTCTVKEYRACM